VAASSPAPAVVPCTGDNAANVATLRNAIAAANTTGSGTVTLARSCVYSLRQPDNTPSYTSANGLPIITGAVSIRGEGATIQRVSDTGTLSFRFFQVAGGGSLVVDRLTLRGGAGQSGGAVLVLTGGAATLRATRLATNHAGSGGAVAAGTGTHLDIEQSEITHNVADTSGGGVLTASTALVTDTTIAHNSATAGGGVENVLGTITITRSTLRDNTATGAGGALDNEFGDATVSASTVSGNRANIGGGVFSSGSLLVANSTFAGNAAAVGAGVANHHFRAVVVNSTFAANEVTAAGSGSAVYNEGGDFRVVNTIMSANAGGNCNDAAGTAVSDGGHNLSSPHEDLSCPPSFGRGDPMLGPLEDNGGPTETMALAVGSAAIDAGDDTICGAAVDSGGAGGQDQRGVARPQGRHCDIGAVEVMDPRSALLQRDESVAPLVGDR
jgi:hypothetical protein